MKRWISIGLVLAFLLALMPASVLASELSDAGWMAYEYDYSGWTTANGRIYGEFSQMHSNWLRKNCIEDVNNFVLEVDITSSNVSSPYLKVLNNVIDLNANGGTGSQVYIKVADQGNKWMDAQGTRVHVKVMRLDGGEMQVKLTGAGNDRSQI